MIKVAASMGQLALSLRGLAKPEGQGSGPTVASAEAMATPASFFTQTATETPGPNAGPQTAPKPDSLYGEEPPSRGESYTFDVEVSRPMQELMDPDGELVQIVRGSPGGEPAIQNVAPH
jgi:hypothetical protein